MNNYQVAQRRTQALREQNLETQAELMHPDIAVTYPQSGEVIRGKDNYLAMLSSFPSGLPFGVIADPRGTRESVHVDSFFPWEVSNHDT